MAHQGNNFIITMKEGKNIKTYDLNVLSGFSYQELNWINYSINY